MSIEDQVHQLINHTQWLKLKTDRPTTKTAGIYVIKQDLPYPARQWQWRGKGINQRRGVKQIQGQSSMTDYITIDHWENHTIYLYLGQAKDIGHRLDEHFQQSKEDREIVKYIREENQEECGGESLWVKWIPEENHKQLEGKYLKTLERKLCYDLPFNIQQGNGINQKENLPTASQYKQADIRNYRTARNSLQVILDKI